MTGKRAVERLVRIDARPEPAEIDLSRTALIIVDMQNVFAHRGEKSGDVGPSITGELIERTKNLIETARKAALKVVYLRMMKDPERKSKSLISSVGDTRIIEELTPSSGDIVIEKSWYSGFRGATLPGTLGDEVSALAFEKRAYHGGGTPKRGAHEAFESTPVPRSEPRLHNRPPR